MCRRYLAQNPVLEEDVFVVQAGEMLIGSQLAVPDRLSSPDEAALIAQATTT